jgi:threonine dehydrogenase-like Zn-dependent dehydrogenase
LAPNSNIIAIDHSDEKLELADKLGADYTVNSKQVQDIKSEVFKITEGKGVNAIFDCVGAEVNYNALYNVNIKWKRKFKNLFFLEYSIYINS